MRRAVSSKLVDAQSDSIFLPFLYQTRTLTAPYRRTQRSSLLSQLSSRQPCQYSTSQILYSNSEPSFGDHELSSSRQPTGSSDEVPSYLKLRASRLSKHKRSGTSSRSTLTEAEKRVFRQLSDSKNDKSHGKNSSQGKTLRKSSTIQAPGEQNEASEISSIFSSAVQDLNKAPSPVISAAEVKQDEARRIEQPDEPNTPDRETALESGQFSKIVSKLRAFRDSPVDGSSPENEQFSGIDPFPLAKLIAKRESIKICKELDDAVAEGKGDIGVWNVCENKIFGMLKLVDLENIASLPDLKQDSIKQDIVHSQKRLPTSSPSGHGLDGTRNKREPVESESPLDIPEHVPVVTVVSKVYPNTLLHAAELLHSNFPMSQYSNQLLDTVKAHGRASFVMGASVELCNELISFRWRVYSDLPYIVSLLEEMEEAGIEFNWDTLSIVDDIRKQRQMDKYTTRTQNGDSDSGTWWWDSEATRSSYKDLAGWGRGKVGWITRIRAQLRNSQRRNSKLDELSKQIF